MIGNATAKRRQFLKFGLLGTVAPMLLAACGGKAAAPTAASSASNGAPPTTAPKPASAAPTKAVGAGVQALPTLAPSKMLAAAVPTPVGTMEGDLILWHDFGNVQGGGLAMLDLVAEFTHLYPKVHMTNVYDATQQKYLAAIASGKVPDLLALSAPDIPTIGQRGALLALDSYISRDKWDLKQYFDFAVEQCTWNGKTYGITNHPDIRCMFYNTDIFTKAGLDPQTPPKTWDDLVAWGAKMNEQQSGRYSTFGYVPSWEVTPWPTQIMQANGAKLLSDDGRKPAFNSDESAAALNWVVDAINKIDGGYDNTVTMIQSQQYPGGVPPQWLFSEGKIGMVAIGNWTWNAITIINAKLPAKNAAFPGGPQAKGQEFVFSGGTMVTIPKGAQHADLAWEWLKFLGSPEGGYLVQARTSDVSGNIAAANNPTIVKEKLGRAEVLPLFSKANRFSYLRSPISQQFDAEMNRMADKVLLKQSTVKQALAASEKAIQQALDDYWATQK